MCEARCPKKAIEMVQKPSTGVGKHVEKEMAAV
jgi:formate hydrogenlyase subunit 6/NADH:ubiquinone oxidoreductase subunit I